MPVYSARKPTTLVDKNGTDIAQSALMMKTKSRTGSIMPVPILLSWMSALASTTV